MSSESFNIRQSSESRYIVPVRDDLISVSITNASKDTLYILVSNKQEKCTLDNYTTTVAPGETYSITAQAKHIQGFTAMGST